MPRKKAASASNSSSAPRLPLAVHADAPWGGYINIRLTDTQVEAYRAWAAVEGAATWWNLFTELVDTGAKIGLVYDSENECYIASLTGRLLFEFESRYCMTARGATLEETVSLLVWKHFILAQGNYDDYRPRTGTFLRFG